MSDDRWRKIADEHMPDIREWTEPGAEEEDVYPESDVINYGTRCAEAGARAQEQITHDIVDAATEIAKMFPATVPGKGALIPVLTLNRLCRAVERLAALRTDLTD